MEVAGQPEISSPENNPEAPTIAADRLDGASRYRKRTHGRSLGPSIITFVLCFIVLVLATAWIVWQTTASEEEPSETPPVEGRSEPSAVEGTDEAKMDAEEVTPSDVAEADSKEDSARPENAVSLNSALSGVNLHPTTPEEYLQLCEVLARVRNDHGLADKTDVDGELLPSEIQQQIQKRVAESSWQRADLELINLLAASRLQAGEPAAVIGRIRMAETAPDGIQGYVLDLPGIEKSLFVGDPAVRDDDLQLNDVVYLFGTSQADRIPFGKDPFAIPPAHRFRAELIVLVRISS